MKATTKIILVAFAAGVLGLAAGMWRSGPGPLLGAALRSDVGQRALQAMVAANAPAAPEGLAIAQRGQPMPALALATLDGRVVSLPGDYAGQPLLINLWASWCGPCLAELPELDRFSSNQGAIGTQVIGIALDDPDDVRAFLKHTPVSFAVVIDHPGPRDSGVQLGNPKGVLPFSVLVGADGRVLKQKLGPFEPGEIENWARQH